MGLFDHFPYTNFHELNLDWILRMLREIDTTMEQFVAINTLKYANPIQWDITSQYEKNTIVIDPQSGTAYISVQPVPTGVSISNTDYWTPVFDLGAFVTRAAKNFTSRYEDGSTLTATFSTPAGGWIVWGDTLYKALVNITAGDSYVVDSNIKNITMEEVKDEIYTTFNTMIGDLDNLATVDKSNLVAAINEIAQMITDEIGDLTNLTTTDKSNVVAAINEVNNALLILDQQMQTSGYWITPEMYGAIGDGITDDHDAIVAAATAANNDGKLLVFKDTTYLIKKEIYLHEFTNLHMRGIGNATVKLEPDSSTSPSDYTSVIEMPGAANLIIDHLTIDCNYTSGANGFGANGTGSTTKFRNCILNDITVLHSVIDSANLGGHGVTFQYNIANCIINNLHCIDCQIGLDLTGTQYNPCSAIANNLIFDNCETAFTSYDLQSQQDAALYNDIRLNNVFCYDCGYSQPSGQPNSHLNSNAVGDGSDGGVFEIMQASGIHVTNATVDNSGIGTTIGGIVRGGCQKCTFDILAKNVKCKAIFNITPPANISPVSNVSGTVYYRSSKHSHYQVRVENCTYTYFVLLHYIPGTSTPRKVGESEFIFDGITNYPTASNLTDDMTYVDSTLAMKIVNSLGYYDKYFPMNQIAEAAGSPNNCYAYSFSATTLQITGTYNKPLRIGSLYLWANANKLYGKSSAPTSATDGSVIATL